LLALFGPHADVHVLLNDERTEVVGVVMPGDPEDELSYMPSEYLAVRNRNIEIARRFYERGYVPRDAIALEGPQLTEGWVAGQYGAGRWAPSDREWQSVYPDAWLETIVSFDLETTRIPFEGMHTGLQQVIPVHSTQKDRTMRFYDWLFASEENYWLLMLGVEGEHYRWTADGKVEHIPSDQGQTYNFLGTKGWQLGNNFNWQALPAGESDFFYRLQEFQSNPDNYYLRPLGNFTFDPAPVRTEMTLVSQILHDEARPLQIGMVENPVVAMEELNRKAREVGLETIRSEIVKQVNAYLAAGGR